MIYFNFLIIFSCANICMCAIWWVLFSLYILYILFSRDLIPCITLSVFLCVCIVLPATPLLVCCRRQRNYNPSDRWILGVASTFFLARHRPDSDQNLVEIWRNRDHQWHGNDSAGIRHAEDQNQARRWHPIWGRNSTPIRPDRGRIAAGIRPVPRMPGEEFGRATLCILILHRSNDCESARSHVMDDPDHVAHGWVGSGFAGYQSAV